MFWRRRTYSEAAGGWLRDPAAPIGKAKWMDDGELTALLLSQQPKHVEEVEKEAFESLVRLRESLLKASGAVAVAYAIGLLSLSNTITALSASGMEIERAAFGHVSLLLIGFSHLWWSTTYAKACYITSWFSWRMRRAEPPAKAVMLLRYPEAFPYWSYFSGARGYPKDIYPERSSHYQLAALLLTLTAIVIFAVGAGALNIMLAVDVWRSAYPTAAAAKLTVAGSIVLALLAMSVPRFNDFRIRYNHYGLANLLAGMSDKRQQEGHRRIAVLSLRKSQDENSIPR